MGEYRTGSVGHLPIGGFPPHAPLSAVCILVTSTFAVQHADRHRSKQERLLTKPDDKLHHDYHFASHRSGPVGEADGGSESAGNGTLRCLGEAWCRSVEAGISSVRPTGEG